MFFSQLFEKQLGRQRAMLDAFVVRPFTRMFVSSLMNQAEQMRVIDGAKAPGKRRKGVAFFVRHFPVSYPLRFELSRDPANI
jgi:hypothetical protein